MQVERVSVDSNFFDDLGADSMVMARFCARVRKRPDLPAVSIKDIYQHPTISSLATALADAAPMPVERVFADVLADVVQVERVSVDSNFFDDLGADSMVMARFCARVSKRPDLPAVSCASVRWEGPGGFPNCRSDELIRLAHPEIPASVWPVSYLDRSVAKSASEVPR